MVGKNLDIVAQRWTLCESHLLKLYLGAFQPSVCAVFMIIAHFNSQHWRLCNKIDKYEVCL